MIAASRPLPPFTRTSAADGALAFSWPAFASARAFLVVSLRDPDSFGADAFWAGEVDNDLIRVPVDTGAGRGEAWVPAGRAVAVALVARDAAGALLASPALVATHGAALQHCEAHEHTAERNASAALHDGAEADGRVVVAATVLDGAPSQLSGPVAHAAVASRTTPFIFVTGEGTPDLEALARRVAQRVTTTAREGAAPATPVVPRVGAGCFGTKPKWYLTRLALPPAGAHPRLLVRSARFIDADLLAAWSSAPPADASPLPGDADGVIDGVAGGAEDGVAGGAEGGVAGGAEGGVAGGAEGGLAGSDATVFYALLEGPPPWRPLPLSPLPPPFSGAERPYVLGDAAARLDAALTTRLDALAREPLALTDLVAVLALIEGAVAWLPADHPVRARAARAVAALRSEPRF